MKQLALALVLLIPACQPKQSADTVDKSTTDDDHPTTGFIERVHDSLDRIISPEAKLEILAEGFDWTEGPLWVNNHDFLLFSDIPPNAVYRWDETNGLQEYLHPSGYTGAVQRGGEVGSNGLLLDDQDNLLLCQHGDRRIAMMVSDLDDPQPVFETVVDNYQGKRLNSPNDATFAKNGDLFFTDPPYGLERNVDDPAKELPFQGVYKLTTEGELLLLTEKLTRPNGIALSTDQSKLYVANSDPESALWMEFQIQSDGTIDEGRVFYDATSWVASRKGLPDGMKVHASGTLFATGPGGVWIFNENGEHLGTIRTGEATSNCALDSDSKYLYITADMYLMRIALLK